MYWEIPKQQVLQSISWPVSHLSQQRNKQLSFFAIHRGGDKIMDRLGKGTEDVFWNVPVPFVMQYVKWELYMNTMFTLGPLILEEGAPRGAHGRLAACQPQNLRFGPSGENINACAKTQSVFRTPGRIH